jgi:hypothetical protein
MLILKIPFAGLTHLMLHLMTTVLQKVLTKLLCRRFKIALWEDKFLLQIKRLISLNRLAKAKSWHLYRVKTFAWRLIRRAIAIGLIALGTLITSKRMLRV